MKALVCEGPGQRGWDSVPDPTVVDPTDIVVRIETSAICGSDLHILAGDVPETTPGRVPGDEAVGTVEEIGAGVSTVTPGDPVLLSCISSCGRCLFLQGPSLRPVSRRWRLDPRPSDRWAAGRLRAHSVRRQFGLPGSRGAQG